MAVKFKTQSKVSKTFSRIRMIISEFFEKGYYYSWKLALYNTAWWIGNYCHPLVNLQYWSKKKITLWMDNYLITNILPPPSNAYTSNRTYVKDTLYCKHYRIWVFWWQGEDEMPELVKACFRQLKFNNQNVILVTRYNVREYCDIPDFIFHRVEKGEISFTHLSDILRVSLLAKHGGMWIDSTCWISETIPTEIKTLPFVSPKTNNQPELPFWSNSRWCGWCTGTNLIGNPLFVFTRDLFYAFYKKNSRIPFYLFIDYVYDYAYRMIPEVKEMVDGLPENNINRNKLHFYLNKAWNETEYQDVCKNNWVFKLSYKSQWKPFTKNGLKTYYGQLIADNIELL